jgi:hypothetical protein
MKKVVLARRQSDMWQRLSSHCVQGCIVTKHTTDEGIHVSVWYDNLRWSECKPADPAGRAGPSGSEGESREVGF